ncbi:hypothetical protein GCM10012275_14620 [Longimycelium tulufanense]|uniref:CYTH domain-containing protein n=1 Tax=Longimycelium tulufanense TaxID=907463 RepID=A0A8J3CBI8_9PSEU|nr:class IV adenylate cyclase [Longimycelium tulufanense]GGM44644.1 hypothetical protein GCM10012275_14620 [Longimycelium tulufanense]
MGESLKSFRAGIELAIARLRELAEHNAVEVYLYTSLPTWRVIGLDDTLFVSAFGAEHEEHESGCTRSLPRHTVPCIEGSGGSSMECVLLRSVSFDGGGMAIEAELKARVRDAAAVRDTLEKRAPGEPSVYRDTYFDWPDGSLSADDRELRVRVVENQGGTHVLLTYKTAAVDRASDSKPEHETEVGSAEVLREVLVGLGLRELIAFEKHCVNHVFRAGGRELLATLVRVPELEETFLEVETPVCEEHELAEALDVVRTVLAELGITDADVTTERYTDAVRTRRG